MIRFRELLTIFSSGARTQIPNQIEYKNRLICTDKFIVGIDPQKFTDALQKPEVQERIKSLRERYKGVKVIVGVDRLDHIKGLTQKLKSFDAFLDDHPELQNKIVLIQVAVPSREDVKEYRELETELSTLAGKINGKHGEYDFQTRYSFVLIHQPLPRAHRCYTCTAQCLLLSSQHCILSLMCVF